MTRDKTKRQAATHFGVAMSTISRWVKSGRCPHTRRENGVLMFNFQEVRTWLKDRNKSTRPGRAPFGEQKDHDNLKKAKMHLAAEKALAAKRKREIEEGKYHLVADCERRMVMKIHVVKAAMLGLGRSLAPELVGKGVDAIEFTINERMEGICRTFAGKEE